MKLLTWLALAMSAYGALAHSDCYNAYQQRSECVSDNECFWTGTGSDDYCLDFACYDTCEEVQKWGAQCADDSGPATKCDGIDYSQEYTYECDRHTKLGLRGLEQYSACVAEGRCAALWNQAPGSDTFDVVCAVDPDDVHCDAMQVGWDETRVAFQACHGDAACQETLQQSGRGCAHCGKWGEMCDANAQSAIPRAQATVAVPGVPGGDAAAANCFVCSPAGIAVVACSSALFLVIVVAIAHRCVRAKRSRQLVHSRQQSGYAPQKDDTSTKDVALLLQRQPGVWDYEPAIPDNTLLYKYVH